MEWQVTIPTYLTKHPCIEKVKQYVLKNLNEDLTLKSLAKAANVSHFYLCRLFKEELETSPMKWLWTQRTLAAAGYLAENLETSLTDIAFACGFSSSAHFSRQFKSVYLITPSQYKSSVKARNSHELTISFAIPPEFKNVNFEFVDHCCF